MKLWILSKYTTIPGYELLPSRWFMLSKYFVKNHNLDVTIFTGSFNHLSTQHIDEEELIIENVNFKIVNSLKYKKTGSVKRVLSWLHWELKLFFSILFIKEKPDIVVCSSLSLFSIVNGLFLKVCYGTKTVFEIRDIWPLTLIEEGKFSKLHPLVILMSAIEYIGYKYSDLIVGTMPGLHLHVNGILGYEKNVFISPFGIDSNENNININETKTNFTIGYAGSIATSNALDNFIDAIKKSSEEKFNIKYLIIGNGDKLNEYKTKLKYCSNVIFIDKVKHNKVFSLIKTCDILYLSTHKSEIWKYGQSMNKIVDYMYSGKPIIATYDGFESMINEANCGEFIKHSSSEDLINLFLKYKNMTKAELIKIGKNGNRWIKKNRQYSKLANEYYDHLRKIIN